MGNAILVQTATAKFANQMTEIYVSRVSMDSECQVVNHAKQTASIVRVIITITVCFVHLATGLWLAIVYHALSLIVCNALILALVENVLMVREPHQQGHVKHVLPQTVSFVLQMWIIVRSANMDTVPIMGPAKYAHLQNA